MRDVVCQHPCKGKDKWELSFVVSVQSHARPQQRINSRKDVLCAGGAWMSEADNREGRHDDLLVHLTSKLRCTSATS